jgi:hypothetical protein
MNDERGTMNCAFHSSFIILPLFPPQHQIDQPAAADMRSRSAAMAQDVRVATARFRKGVGQFRHPLDTHVVLSL